MSVKNYCRLSKGRALESFHSERLASKRKVPILISSSVLRKRNMGQVDLAFYDQDKKEIYLFEIKSHEISLGKKQYSRLRRSSDWISRLLGCSITFRVLS